MNPRGLLLMAAVPAIVALFAPPRLPPGPAAPDRTISGAPMVPTTRSPAYARLIARHVREGTIEGVRLRVVDYEAIARDPDLQLALAELAEARPEEMSRDDRMAFWINAYNLLVIRLVVDGYPIESILDLESEHEDVFETAAGTAGRRLVSLEEIEHVILRREFRDPRIHFALVAAAVSCPDLRAYDGERLDAQLEGATRTFMADEQRGIRFTRSGAEVSQLFHSFHEDFEPGGIVAFVRAHAPATVAARFEGLEDHDLGTLSYDWRLNDLARSSLAGSP